MASTKYLLFAAFLIAVMASQTARAQLPGLGQVHINGTVHCSVGIVPTAITPVFPTLKMFIKSNKTKCVIILPADALMALQCGGSVISTTTTNNNGVFDFSLNLLSSLFSTLLNDCNLIVSTPLSTCDTSLPSIGSLQSPLQLLSPASGLLGEILSGILQLIPSGFSLIN